MLCSVASCVLLFTIAQLLPSRRNVLPSTLFQTQIIFSPSEFKLTGRYLRSGVLPSP
jgi:hypothetical protein